MSVPDYESFMLPLLRAVADGEEHLVRDVRDRLAAEFKLRPDERSAMLPSGKQSVFDNRVGWAKTYLDKAGLISSVRRGVYRITEAGRAVLAERPKSIDKNYLEKFEPFRTFLTLRHGDDAGEEIEAAPALSATATPEEQLEGAYRRIRQKIEADVLESVKGASPGFSRNW